MDTLTCRFAGEGNRPAIRGAHLAVGRNGELERDMRSAVAHAANMAGVIAARRFGGEADIDRDAGRAQPRMPGSGNLQVRILKRRDHARDTRRDDGVGAWRRFAVMRARLERNVKGGAARSRPGAADRLDLGMRPAPNLRPATADDQSILDDHCTYSRIGPGTTQAAPT